MLRVTIAAVAALVLAGCGGASEDTDSAADAVTAAEVEAPAADEQEDTTEEPEPEPEPESEAGTRENPLPLGEATTIGDYKVTVTAVNLDATDVVLDVNEFNEDPAGTYVLVSLAGTFLGEDDTEGMPGWELSAVIVGSDAKQYRDTETFAVPPSPLIEGPTLEAGGEFEGNFVIDVPTEALDGAALFVEAILSFDEERAYFALG